MSTFVSQGGGGNVHIAVSSPRPGVVEFTGQWSDADYNDQTWTPIISADDALTHYNELGDVLRALNKL